MTRAVAVALVLAAALARPAAANPVDAFGFGARGPAMGNAQTAASQDAGANYYNPAILATFDAIRVDIGYQFAEPRLEIDGRDLDVNRSRGLAVGAAVPGRIGPVRVAIGAGLFLPDEQVVRTRTLANDQPRFQLYDNRPQRIFLGANVAAQLGDRLFIGGGIGYLSRTSGTVGLEGRLGFPQATDSDLSLAVDVDLKTIRYPLAGALFRALPWLDLGVAYRGGFVLEVDLQFDIRGDVGPEGAVPVVEDGYFGLLSRFQDLFQPEQFAAGVAAQLTPALSVAFDVVWHRWSAFDNPATVVDFDYDLKDFDDLVDIPEAPALSPPNFADIVVPHLGLEWTASRGRRAVWRVRGGYTYEPSPVPRQSGTTNFVDSDKHTAAAGVGLELRELTEVLIQPLDLDLYAAVTAFEDRVTRKLSPVDRIGDYAAGGAIWQIGASSRWRF